MNEESNQGMAKLVYYAEFGNRRLRNYTAWLCLAYKENNKHENFRVTIAIPAFDLPPGHDLYVKSRAFPDKYLMGDVVDICSKTKKAGDPIEMMFEDGTILELPSSTNCICIF